MNDTCCYIENNISAWGFIKEIGKKKSLIEKEL